MKNESDYSKNMRILLAFVLILLCTSFCLNARSVFILIHGTWGAESSWYMPQGDFFDALEETVRNKNSSVVPFRWSGGCGHESRVKAAHNLVKLIQTYSGDTVIYLIAHSHGGNVAAIASQILAQDDKNKFKIRALFNLGTPIMSNYLPNMNIITYIYNLFSFEDLIQTVLGVSGREYSEHKRIANIRVFINDKEPDHSGLHHQLIGKWIPYLHRYFKQFLQDNEIYNTIFCPAIIYLAHEKNPEFVFDNNRNYLLERDRKLSLMILTTYSDISRKQNDIILSEIL